LNPGILESFSVLKELLQMTEPLVSIMMVTYNHAPYITQAIEGVLKQKTNFPIELVIGEDCSTDGTREIVFGYQKKYPDIIRVIASDKNVGALENSERTAKTCRGKYIAFCEGDDYWHHPGKLQKQADYFESHPDCGLVFSSYDVYHVQSKKGIRDFIKYRKWEIPEKWDISDFVAGKRGVLTCTVMVRRTILDQVREADPYLHQSDQFLMRDTQIWAEISTIAHLHYIPESLATHNITVESATRSRDIKKRLRFAISGAKLMLYLANKYNAPISVRKKHEESWCDYSLQLAIHSRNAELADEVRRQKKTFTWKQWCRYYGAKNLAIHHIFWLTDFFRNLFRKENNEWL
jgi:glycosyltransferase involved in cell wall biosynthesis